MRKKEIMGHCVPGDSQGIHRAFIGHSFGHSFAASPFRPAEGHRLNFLLYAFNCENWHWAPRLLSLSVEWLTKGECYKNRSRKQGMKMAAPLLAAPWLPLKMDASRSRQAEMQATCPWPQKSIYQARPWPHSKIKTILECVQELVQ